MFNVYVIEKKSRKKELFGSYETERKAERVCEQWGWNYIDENGVSHWMEYCEAVTKKEVCEANPSRAYYSGFGGLEIKYIDYGINDYIYCVSGAWTGKPSYHKLKIYYDKNEVAYIKLHGYKIPLNECIRMEVVSNG